MKFTEQRLEQAIISLLGAQGYPHVSGESLLRDPQTILYINGLPLVVCEFKSAIRPEATLHDAYVQLTVRYRRDIPELLKYNALCVISDGVNSKVGSLFAPYEFFYAWRKVSGNESIGKDGIGSLHTLVQGLFDSRSQVNLDQKIRLTEQGVKRTYGFAKYLHDSLPNATYVGFTGTPVDATLDVFESAVDAYTMTESVKDDITVRLVYEGRAAKVLLDNRQLLTLAQAVKQTTNFKKYRNTLDTGILRRLTPTA